MKKRAINRSKRVDKQCGNHGNCPYCRQSRLYQANREIERTNQELKEYEATKNQGN